MRFQSENAVFKFLWRNGDGGLKRCQKVTGASPSVLFLSEVILELVKELFLKLCEIPVFLLNSILTESRLS